MKKTIICVILAAVAALSVFAADASVDKAKKNEDLDSIYQTILQSRHELAMMHHVAKALEDGATLQEIHEHFSQQAEMKGQSHEIQRTHEEMQNGEHAVQEMKLKGSHQDKLNQLAAEAEKLQQQIQAFHKQAALHVDSG